MPQYIVVVNTPPKHTFTTAIQTHGESYLFEYLASKLPTGSPVKVQSVMRVPDPVTSSPSN